MEPKQGYRIEHDCIGECLIPENAYYGIHTQRATENFKITGRTAHKEIIKSIAQIKKACAIANYDAGVLSEKKKEAIVYACNEIIWGRFHDQFITDPIQGGAGTSHNMNANEVIANIAIEHLGGRLGDYSIIHPNDDVNMGQSTNDVYPTSGKLALIRLLEDTIDCLYELEKALSFKAKEFDDVIKMGRTQMQDAIPIRLGQEFSAYATVISRNIKLFKKACVALRVVNMGATAIGTGLNADVKYMKNIVKILGELTDLDLEQSEDLIDGTQNIDVFVYVSGILKSCAISMSKMANDLRLMSSGPTCGFSEINLPARQAGSSIMPGKVNPVIPEVVSQVAFNCIGNDLAVTMAAEAGQLELNAFEPVIFYNLFESVETLGKAASTFVHNCILGITANSQRTKNMVHNSYGIVTAFAPHIGYEKSVEVIHKAIEQNLPVKAVLISEKIMSEEEIDNILDVFSMTTPGIAKRK
ncbi:MAG: aspartate ammonia-lyase [Peptoniphilaceae bacterium]|uniref:aspartate ammonia-lyase n=1 Tax=Parvimonas sp. TaxID=1944660 RepID=UPI0025EEFF79|nr:aspartate ammonia-lyase [Parvimonas sp.]MCI5997298.1 aspartate ammonia-lyase [Parvimonas sp.]MDD7765428.1 aspartate ammonia-lyase [Peptoniphilaceae bacterium]MDY3050969.1 aspartate ammonia-lyase [Parvimonas sp.]